MTEICEHSIRACFEVAPVQVINLVLGGIAAIGLAITVPLALWSQLCQRGAQQR